MNKTFNRKLFNQLYRSQSFLGGIILISIIITGLVLYYKTYEFPIGSYAEAYIMIFSQKVNILVIIPMFLIVNSRLYSYYWQPQILLRFEKKSIWWKKTVQYIALCSAIFTAGVLLILFLLILFLQAPPFLATDPWVILYAYVSCFLVYAIIGMNYIFMGYLTKNSKIAFLYAYLFEVIDMGLFFARAKIQLMIGYLYTPMQSNATLFSSLSALIYLILLFTIISVLYSSIIVSQRRGWHRFG